MSEINKANFTPEAPNFKQLVLMNFQGLTNFPYIEEDFDALTNYGLLSKVVEYLNQVISNNNEQNDLMTALYNAYVSLQNYVNDYFENLDVQEEINNKLDEMAQDGSLTNLIKAYVDPIYEAYELQINSDITQFKNGVNSQIDSISNMVDSAVSGSPLKAATTADMTDTSRIYVLATDGHWYYYNGSAWTDGGVYQGTDVNDNSISGNKIYKSTIVDSNVIKGAFRSTNGSIMQSTTYEYTDFLPIANGDTISVTNAYSDYALFWDIDKQYLGKYSVSEKQDINRTLNLNDVAFVSLNLTMADDHIVKINGKDMISVFQIDWLRITNENFKSDTIDGSKIKEHTISGKEMMNTKGIALTKGTAWNNMSSPRFVNAPTFHRTTDLIEVTPGDIITFKNVRSTYAVFFNANQEYAYNLESSSLAEEKQYVVSSTIHYMGININPNVIDTFKVYINDNELIFDTGVKYTLPWLTFTEEQVSEITANVSRFSDYKVLFIGDSITEHNFRANKNWVDYITEDLNITDYYNGGMSGTGILTPFGSSPDWITALPTYDDDFDLVLIMGDMNDWSHKTFDSSKIGNFGDSTTDTFYGTMKVYLEMILNKYPLAKVGWITSTPRNETIAGTSDNLHGKTSIFNTANNIIKEMCNNYSIPVLELYKESNLYPWISANNTEYFTPESGGYIADGVHPNSKGQRIMAYKIYNFIIRNF